MQQGFILPLAGVGLADLSRVGGKNASLGEMLRHLAPLGVNIPDGFVITVAGYEYFLESAGLQEKIRQCLDTVDHEKVETLRRAGLQIRTLIRNAHFPKDLAEAIIQAYSALSSQYDQSQTDVAVRSSATAEDLPDASFAGQQETYLNVRGPAELIDAVRNCFASLFTDRAISYRHTFQFDAFAIGLSVGIQKMVRSDLGAAGVAFSLDTESGFRDVVLINGSYGLGELLVQGAVSPDEFLVFKPTLKQGFASIIEKKRGSKEQMMVYGDNPDERVKVISTDKATQSRFCLHDEQILQISRWVVQIESYYSQLKGQWCPMDIEWALDGLTGQLFIVQARPETIHSRRDPAVFTEYRMDTEGLEPILKGIAVGDKVASGKICILHSLDKRVGDGREFRAGDILVTDMTDPDWEPIMKMAAAIITNKGGRTCHAAIVARELGVPAIVGCGHATELLKDDQLITACCSQGETGLIFEGELSFEKIETRLEKLPNLPTRLMLNIGSPDLAFSYSHLPHQGVGLAREEFIINNFIGIHPMALLRHRQLNDPALSQLITERIRGFDDEANFFIHKLAFGIARIAAAFYPETVIVRFSDFKSNEYSNLIGGKHFEPQEENPMIGWRGASRYYSPQYKEAFGLECQAIKKVRDEWGLTNVAVMIPFCRTVEELHRVYGVMKEFRIPRGMNGLQVYLMAELPSNVILAREFARHIDGFSIGSNDLTQLTLGLDRDSSLVAHLYDERNEAVKSLIRSLIQTAKEAGVKVGICGQGPSDFPDFARFLVEEGIDSISVTPDAVKKTIGVLEGTGMSIEE